MTRFQFHAELWEYGGDASWFFLSLPTDVADAISDEVDVRPQRRGFGAVKVIVSIGSTAWSTSVFPDTKLGTYVLPVKKAVRRAEGLDAGSRVKVVLDLAPVS